jgi:hypothetical protein
MQNEIFTSIQNFRVFSKQWDWISSLDKTKISNLLFKKNQKKIIFNPYDISYEFFVEKNK